MENPFDKPPVEIDSRGMEDDEYVCTVVNLIPLEIEESKPHISPGVYVIPPATKDENGIVVPGLLYVGEAFHYLPDPIIERNIKQITPPREMARSLVEDYCNCHIGLDSASGPGMFWLQRRVTLSELLARYQHRLREYTDRQTRWFKNLVSMADADWQKNKDMMAVSNLQRLAAHELNIEKEWVNFVIAEMHRCPYCTTAIDVSVVKCPNCHEIVNPEKYKQLRAREVA